MVQDKPVRQICVTIIVLPGAASPAYTGPCAQSIAHLQRKVDAAIEQRAGSGPWKPESVEALRGHQPTPRSVAAAEAGNGPGLEDAQSAKASRHDEFRIPAPLVMQPSADSSASAPGSTSVAIPSRP
jgi:hypothetical protein